MNCRSCGAFLNDQDLDYCPQCGANVLIQKKTEYLSRLYYNQGLEKASIRDLSGAITCLKSSLMFNKGNIQARNLLGLVYFETGEVVSALSEWVISKNLRPARNLASEYINKLQANPGKLEAINETIRKYNSALALCREGHEDMAAIQLKKVLTQNPKLIKGYHLLALIQMKEHAWNKARRTLRKAARIDKTNTTTLRFLREVDERTGVATKLDGKRSRKHGEAEHDGNRNLIYQSGNDVVIQPPAYKERSMASLLATLGIGVTIGAAAFWFLILPSVKQGIYKEANQQIIDYSDYIVSQEAELSQIKGEIRGNDNSQDAAQAQQQIAAVQARSNSYEALLAAYSALQANNVDEAGEHVQKVKPSTLNETARAIYEQICSTTGSSGSEDLYNSDVVDPIDTASDGTDTSDGTGMMGTNSGWDASGTTGTGNGWDTTGTGSWDTTGTGNGWDTTGTQNNWDTTGGGDWNNQWDQSGYYGYEDYGYDYNQGY